MASSAPTIVEIELHKGPSGLGFNIRGGIDNIHIGTDPGIFVTTIKPNGAAAHDGTLQIGDKILEVNGTSLRQVHHKEAVRCFQDTGDVIKMVVETGAEARISKMLKEQSHESKSIPTEAGEQTTTEHDCGNSQIHAQRSSSTQMLFATVVIVAAAAIILGIVLSRR